MRNGQEEWLSRSVGAAVDQPRISILRRGRLGGFSTDRLFRFLDALGLEVETVIKPPLPGDEGRQGSRRGFPICGS